MKVLKILLVVNKHYQTFSKCDKSISEKFPEIPLET